MTAYKGRAHYSDIVDTRNLIKDEDWEDITDWTTYGTGTRTVEESPAGQLHLVAGDAGGTDSTGGKYLDSLVTNLQTMTVEFKIKFDQLAGGWTGTPGATNDFFQFRHYSGVYMHVVTFTSDSVWYYTAGNVHVKQFDTTFDNVSWYTIRLIFDSNFTLVFAKDDDADWNFLGRCRNADPYTILNGRILMWVINYPTSPAETEIHMDYVKFAPGMIMP